MLVQSIASAAALRARRRARQRKGRVGKIDHRDAYRGRAAEGRPARRHDRSRLAPESFTHYIENRRAWAKHAGSISNCRRITASRAPRAMSLETTRRTSSPTSPQAIDAIEHTHDFVVIDTPGNDSYLMRLAHSMADTLITPLNDSFVDFDVLGTVDPATFAVTGDQPLRRDGARGAPPAPRWSIRPAIDWIVVRNRLSMLGSRNKRLVGEGLQRTCRMRLGFRCVDGFAERVIYPRILPARADRARRSRRGDARHAARACRT